MALFTLSEKDRMLEYDCVELLPDLEEAVLFFDMAIADLDETYSSGFDDWWPAFIADMSL